MNDKNDFEISLTGEQEYIESDL